MSTPKKILVAVSTGTESIEFSAPYDILKRAGGELTIAKVKDPNEKEKSLEFVTAQGLKIKTDKYIEDCINDTYDLIICPGGLPNAEYLGQCKELIDLLTRHKKEGKFVSAICASPAMVFEPHGILEGHCGTCYPSMQGSLKNQEKVKERVVVSGNVITSQGPCTAVEFGFMLCELLFGKPTADELKSGMVFA
ncbi:MAG: DJ-1/PfpI family protein [archaeon]|nr:DJ-1/PfpI family protein [archaeon]